VTAGSDPEIIDDRPGAALLIIPWESIPGDRWSTLAELSRRQLVLVAIGSAIEADPMALLAAGARAVVVDGGDSRDLAVARAAVLAGGSYLAPAVLTGGLIAAGAGAPRSAGALGPREVETLRHLVGGLTHRQAARELGVTEKTVSTYAKRLRRKLCAGNAAELVQRAITLGYVQAMR
jgi:DNA-binding NarL/FixJ family response regulator